MTKKFKTKKRKNFLDRSYIRKTCPTCKGSGYAKGFNAPKCGRCEGTGKIKIYLKHEVE